LGPFADGAQALNAWQAFSLKAPGQVGLVCGQGTDQRILMPAESLSQARAFCAVSGSVGVACAVVEMTCPEGTRPIGSMETAMRVAAPTPPPAPAAPRAVPPEAPKQTAVAPKPAEAIPLKADQRTPWQSPLNRTVPPEGYRPLNAPASEAAVADAPAAVAAAPEAVPAPAPAPVAPPPPPPGSTLDPLVAATLSKAPAKPVPASEAPPQSTAAPVPSAVVAPKAPPPTPADAPETVGPVIETREPTQDVASTAATLFEGPAAVRTMPPRAATETELTPEERSENKAMEAAHADHPDGVNRGTLQAHDLATPPVHGDRPVESDVQAPAAQPVTQPPAPVEAASPAAKAPEPTQPPPVMAKAPETPVESRTDAPHVVVTPPAPAPAPTPAKAASVAPESALRVLPPRAPAATTNDPMAAATEAAKAGDFSLAASLLEPLAADNEPLALYNLALLYASGQGVPRDPRKAFELTERAARKGLVSAQNNLGVMYLKGIGVNPDHDLAIRWLNVAAANGHPLAKRSLESLQGPGVTN
jgi:hypothetical protein